MAKTAAYSIKSKIARYIFVSLKEEQILTKISQTGKLNLLIHTQKSLSRLRSQLFICFTFLF